MVLADATFLDIFSGWLGLALTVTSGLGAVLGAGWARGRAQTESENATATNTKAIKAAEAAAEEAAKTTSAALGAALDAVAELADRVESLERHNETEAIRSEARQKAWAEFEEAAADGSRSNMKTRPREETRGYPPRSRKS